MAQRRKALQTSKRSKSTWLSIGKPFARAKQSIPFFTFFMGIALVFVGIIIGITLNQDTPHLHTQRAQQTQAISSATSLHACFTPNEKCLPLILKELDSAQKSIYIQCYAFTSKPIAKLLLKKVKQGVRIKILADKSNLQSKFSQIPYLAHAGIPVLYEKGVRIAHNKVIIIDEKRILTGSYNFSNAAEHFNSENILLIKDKATAQKYVRNFNQRSKASHIHAHGGVAKKVKKNLKKVRKTKPKS